MADVVKSIDVLVTGNTEEKDIANQADNLSTILMQTGLASISVPGSVFIESEISASLLVLIESARPNIDLETLCTAQYRNIPVVLVSTPGNIRLTDECDQLGVVMSLPNALAVEDLAKYASLVLSKAGHSASDTSESNKSQASWDRNRTISIAVGILMATHSITELEAFSVLRKKSRDERRKIITLATDVIRARECLNQFGCEVLEGVGGSCSQTEGKTRASCWCPIISKDQFD